MRDAVPSQAVHALSGGKAAYAASSMGTHTAQHPRAVLLGAQAGKVVLPVCDHYSGVEARMRKSLALQAEMIQEFGACVLDVTLDCEDGAPVGGEIDHVNMVVALINQAQAASKNIAKIAPRIGVRVHAVDHSAFESDVALLIRGAGAHVAYITLPKIERAEDVELALRSIDAAGGAHIPLHVLVESSAAVHRAFDLAAHARVESISFGLMDFVSSHGGAIPADAMGSRGQFTHPLVLRAKADIAAACHAFGKVPSHCVVTEFTDTMALQAAARQASQELGYTRMWSIHPAQIRPILAAFAPSEADIENASKIIAAGANSDWAPTSFKGQLHDRASYRYFWQVLERAHCTGRAIPADVQHYF
jgi:citrate lyase subunit beta / citryl-CoA lyase